MFVFNSIWAQKEKLQMWRPQCEFWTGALISLSFREAHVTVCPAVLYSLQGLLTLVARTTMPLKSNPWPEATCHLSTTCFNPLNAALPLCNHMHCTQLQDGCSTALFTWMGHVWWTIVPAECNRGFSFFSRHKAKHHSRSICTPLAAAFAA